MKRRVFVRGAATAAAACVLPSELRAEPKGPEVAVTMDDFSVRETTLLSAAERGERILAALAARRVRAAAFVVGRNAETDEGGALLASWAKAGHVVANHTYSHPALSRAGFDAFAADVLAAERVLARLPGFSKLFRYPYLDEGDTPATRDRTRAFLHERGYRNGAVTIDASDWYVDSRLRARIASDPRADLAPYRDYYLGHMWDRARYYDGLAREVLGRTVRHTLLVHFNLLNALFLGDLLAMFAANGWRIVDATRAFGDPIFRAAPTTVPAGQSLVWALAKESGRHAAPLRFPGEDGDYEKPKMDALGL